MAARRAPYTAAPPSPASPWRGVVGVDPTAPYYGDERSSLPGASAGVAHRRFSEAAPLHSPMRPVERTSSNTDSLVERVSSAVVGYDTEHTALQSRLTALQAEAEHLRQHLSASAEREQATANELATTQSAAKRLARQVADATARFQETDARLTVASSERMQLRAEAKRLHTTVESLRSELELVAAAKNDADSRVGQLTRELRDVKMELTEVRDAAEAAEKMAKEKRISLDKRVAEQGERLRVVEDQLRLALEALALSDRVSAGYVAQCRQLESMVRKQVTTLKQVVLFDMPESLADVSGVSPAEAETGGLPPADGFLLTGSSFRRDPTGGGDDAKDIAEVTAEVAAAAARTGGSHSVAGGDAETLRLHHRVRRLQRAVTDLEFSRGAATRRFEAAEADLRAVADRQILRHQRVAEADAALRGLEPVPAVTPLPGTTTLAERIVTLLRARTARDVRTYRNLLEDQELEARRSWKEKERSDGFMSEGDAARQRRDERMRTIEARVHDMVVGLERSRAQVDELRQTERDQAAASLAAATPLSPDKTSGGHPGAVSPPSASSAAPFAISERRDEAFGPGPLEREAAMRHASAAEAAAAARAAEVAVVSPHPDRLFEPAATSRVRVTASGTFAGAGSAYHNELRRSDGWASAPTYGQRTARTNGSAGDSDARQTPLSAFPIDSKREP